MSNKKSMREINDWLDRPVVKISSNSHIHQLPYEYYYTPTELKRFYEPETKRIDIDDRTRRNDANNIFCDLVEYCVRYNINDLNGTPLIKPSIKNSFYDFIYLNSRKFP